MIRNRAVEAQPAEPAIGEVEVDLVAHPLPGSLLRYVYLFRHAGQEA